MRRIGGLLAAQSLAVAALVSVAACGGGGSPTTPGGSGGGSSQPGPVGATITIANGRVTPTTVSISAGQSVMFVNNDGRTRNVSSDPHPSHTDCPAINAVGNLGNGQSRPTDALTTPRLCGFHDHDDPDNNNMRGQIEIR